MRTVKFTEDFRFNVTGAQGGQTEKTEGEVYSCNDELADMLVNYWKVARWHDMRPQETKPAAPKEQKLIARNRGGGWYDVFDADGNEIDPNIHGKAKLNQKYPNIEITSA